MRKEMQRGLWLCALLVAGAWACTGGGGSPAPAGAATAASGGTNDAARAEALELFAGRCTPCHGATGGGDGPSSASLSPRPANFQDKAWQAGVTDAHIEKIIKYGGAAVGKSPAMPANPDLTAKSAVVAALREHIRSLPK